MADEPDVQPAPEPVDAAPEAVAAAPEAPAADPVEDTGGEQAHEAEPVAADEPADPAPVDDMKAWCRKNIRWLMAEMNWTRAGYTEEQRAKANP